MQIEITRSTNMIYIGNAFSTSMVGDGNVSITTLDGPQIVRDLVRHNGGVFQSIVGHASTASLFTSILDFEVKANRATLNLVEGDRLVVGQYTGPRLHEGVTDLPDGAVIVWRLVTILRYGEC